MGLKKVEHIFFLVLSQHLMPFWVLEQLCNFMLKYFINLGSIDNVFQKGLKVGIEQSLSCWVPKGKLFVGRETRWLFKSKSNLPWDKIKICKIWLNEFQDAYFKNHCWLHHHDQHHHHQQHLFMFTQLNKVLPRRPPWKQSIKPCYNPYVRTLTLHWIHEKEQIWNTI